MSVEIHAIVSGRVQGVGFRATTRDIARNLQLSGTVRNLADGTVEIVAQGDRALIDKLFQSLHEEFPGGYISAISSKERPAAISYTDFNVVR